MQEFQKPGQIDDKASNNNKAVKIDINSDDIYNATNSVITEVTPTEGTGLVQQAASSPLVQCGLFNCSTATKVNVAKIVGMMLCIGVTAVAFTGVALVFNWLDYKEEANNNMSNSTSTVALN
ncbi:MAG: hypothetical protein ACK4PR_09500 [Gammaproteobacteria bacterium]